MATANNTIKTRVQLKSDTEANWNLVGPREGSAGFVPLDGELIIYSSDQTHHYSRLKVGDGVTNVVNLPFLDAGTINGSTPSGSQVLVFSAYNEFPQPGSPSIIYIDLATGDIYCYVEGTGYTHLSNYTYTPSKTNVSNITYWRGGIATTLSCENGRLTIKNGQAPVMNYEQVSVVQNINRG